MTPPGASRRVDREGVKYTLLGFAFIFTFIGIGLGVGWWLALVIPWFRVAGLAFLQIPAWIVAAGGFGLVLWATVAFGYYGHGTPLPEAPPKRLVTQGPYRHIRNPIYLGWFLGWGGLGVSTGNLAYAGLGLLLLLVGTAYARRGEKPALDSRFGPEFHRWRQETPEFLPRLRR